MAHHRKILLITGGTILLFAFATLTAAVLIKYSYHRDFRKECYHNCYYNKTEKLWEYRPWGYDSSYTGDNRDFPDATTCLGFCLSQKQIDFIK